MKTIIRNLATLVVAFAGLLLGQDAMGAVPITNTLPVSLPIGSRGKMLEWAVASRPFAALYQLSFVDKNHNQQEVYRTGTNIRFTSFAAFEQDVYNRFGELLLEMLTARNPDVRSNATMYIFVDYHDINQVGLVLIKDIGPLSGVHSNSFCGLGPYFSAQAVVPVINLQRVCIQVWTNVNSGDISYSYDWPSRVVYPSPSPYPTEHTTTNILIIDEWCGSGKYRARFLVSALGGYTNVYTQAGSVLVTNPPVRMGVGKDGKLGLTVNISKGADTKIEASVDNVAWQEVVRFSWAWAETTTTISWSPDPSMPYRFFRATSW